MASILDLEKALINADKAGDLEAAKLLANEITKLSASQAPKELSLQEEIIRKAGSLVRGATPPVAGALVGGGLTGLVFPPAAPAGAVVGSVALPLAEMISRGANVLLPNKYDLPSPTAAVERLLTKAGLPEPSTPTERAIQSAGSAVGGVGGQINALGQLAKTATSPISRGIAKTLSQEPVRQLAAAAPAGYVGQRVTEATESPVLGTLAGVAAGAPAFMINRPKTTAPTAEQLKEMSSEAYRKSAEAGVIFKKEPFAQFANQLKVDIGKTARPKRQPQVFDILDEIDTAAQSPKTLEQLEDIRLGAKEVAMSGTPSEKKFASIIINKLDDFVDNATDSYLVSPAQNDVAAIQALKEGRSLWKRARKSETIDDIIENATIRGDDNVALTEKYIRNGLKTLATNKKKLLGFSDEEVTAIKQAAKGGSVQNFLRSFGQTSQNVLATGFESTLLGTAGAAIAGPIGAAIGAAAVPTAKLSARQIGANIGIKNINQLADMIRSGQPMPPTGINLQSIRPLTLQGYGLLNPYMSEEKNYNLLGE